MSNDISVRFEVIRAERLKAKGDNKAPNSFVKLKVDGNKYKTPIIKQSSNPEWKQTFILQVKGVESALEMTVLHDRLAGHDVIGETLPVTVTDLLEDENQDVELALMVPNKGRNAGMLIVRASKISADNLLDSSLLVAGEALQRVESPNTVASIAGATNISSDTANNFDSLLVLLDRCHSIGDAIARVHPFITLAWLAVSAAGKAVTSQVKRDTTIAELCSTMIRVYRSMQAISDMAKLQMLEVTIIDLLKQTAECAVFIKTYSQDRFGIRVVKHLLSKSDAIATEYLNSFRRLEIAFQQGLSVQTTLVTVRLGEEIEDLKADFRLESLNPIPMATSCRPRCLPGSRRDVLEYAIKWSFHDSGKSSAMLWLSGLAGYGKSTIATTLADIFDSVQRCAAFIFFDRGTEGGNPANFIPTLAYKLAKFDSRLRNEIAATLNRRPNILEASYGTQFTELITLPLISENVAHIASGGPFVIVIDGLDECGTPESRKTLLATMVKELQLLPPYIRIIVTSRDEHDIALALSNCPGVTHPLLHDIAVYNNKDIQSFISTKLSEVREENLDLDLDPKWPGHEIIAALASRADGLFVWASTACKLIAEDYSPAECVQRLIEMDIEPSASDALHKLYDTIIQAAGNWKSARFVQDFKDVMGTTVIAKIPLTPGAIESLFGRKFNCFRVLRHFRSVLLMNTANSACSIHVAHPSFSDYITDSSLLATCPWLIVRSLHHTVMAKRCIVKLQQNLKENICALRLEKEFTIASTGLPEDLTYACSYWIEHLCEGEAPTTDVVDMVSQLIEKHVLHWIECMSILRRSHNCVRLLQRLQFWLKEHNFTPTEMLNDAVRFSQQFASLIDKHPLLVYKSALSFAPSECELYKKHYKGPAAFKVFGYEKRWSSLLHVIAGHDDVVTSVAFSSDASMIVSGSRDGTIRAWDAHTGQELFPPLVGHTDWVQSVVISEDQKRIISCSKDKTIRVWDVQTGSEALKPITGHTDSVNSVAISRNGTRIVSGSSDLTVRIWDVATGTEVVPPMRGHKNCVTVASVAISADGSKVVSGADDSIVRLWDGRTGKALLPPLKGHAHGVSSVAISRDGTKIASGSLDYTVRLWDAETGKPLFPAMRKHDHFVTSVAFTADGSRVVSGSQDKTIMVWDTTTGQPIMLPFRGHTNAVSSVAIHHEHDKSRIVSGSNDMTVRVWDSQLAKDLTPDTKAHSHWVSSVAFSPDGKKIVSGSYDMTIRIWDTYTGTELREPLKGHTDWVNSVAFSSDGSKVVSGSYDMTVRIWDVESGKQVGVSMKGHMGWICSVAFSEDAKMVQSVDSDGHAVIWDVATGKALSAPIAPNSPRSASKANRTTSLPLDLKPVIFTPWTDKQVMTLDDGWLCCGTTGTPLSHLPTELCSSDTLKVTSRNGVVVHGDCHNRLLILYFPFSEEG